MLQIPDAPYVSDPIHQGSPVPTDRMNPFMPMPDLLTGELKVDPEIELKAKKFNLAVSLYYSTNHNGYTEYGFGRTASSRTYLEASGNIRTINRGDFSQQQYQVSGTSGSVTTFVSSSNTGNITTLSYDSTPDEYTEYFTTGYQMKYKKHTGGSRYELDRVVDADGVTQTYTYGTSGETGLLKNVTVPGGDKITYSYVTMTVGIAETLITLVSSIEDWGNRRWTMQYDARGALTTLTTPLGCQTKYGYALASTGVSLVHTIEDPRGYVTTYAYDTSGRVASMAAGTAVWAYTYTAGQTVQIEPNGDRITYNYDGNGNNVTTNKAEGYTSTYTYNTNRLLTGEIRPSGSVMSVTYNALNLVETSNDPLGNRTTYQYDDFGNLTTLINAMGFVTTYGYDGSGSTRRRIRETDPVGSVKTYTYTSDGELQTYVNPLGFATTYQYDTKGNLTTILYRDGGSQLMTYDSLNRMRTQTDRNLNVTTYTYDVANHVVTVTAPLGQVTQYIYDTCLLAAVIDARNYRTSYTYDRLGRQTSIEDPLNNITRYGYDNMGYLVSITNALGRVWTTTYHPGHLVHEEIDPLLAITTYSYEPSARLATITNAKNQTTVNLYNARDFTTAIFADSSTKVYEYDKIGRLTTTTNGLGKSSVTIYNTDNTLSAQVSPMGKRTSYVYDAAKQQTERIEPTGARTTTTYNGVGRATAVRNALGYRTTYTYDYEGNLIALQDSNLNYTTYSYDALNRQITSFDAMLATTVYSYDASNNQIGILDAKGAKITMNYSPRNEMVSIQDGIGRVTTYTYGATGMQATRQFANGDVTTYAYDIVDRLATVLYSDATRVTYGYDILGNRTTMEDSTGTTIYSYNSMNQQVTVTSPGGFSIQSQYDAAQQRTTLIDPSSNATVYHYNDDGQVDWFKDTTARTTNYQFDAGGRITTITQPSGMVRTIIYDLMDQQLSLVDRRSNGSTPQKLTMAYDPVGNPLNILDGTGVLSTYTYDKASRITSARLSAPTAGTYSYTYDSVGNKTFSGETTPNTFTYDLVGQLVTSVNAGTTTTYTYDQNGNLTNVVLPWSITTMTYDKENRMTVYSQDGTRTTYTYDGDGMKRTETVSGVTTTLLWDGSAYFGEVSGGIYSKRYYTTNSQVVSYEQTNTTSTRKDYLTDHLGSVTNEFDMTESRTYEARYLPYGLNQWSSGTSDKFGWVGSWGYRATGLLKVSHYVRARHYSNQMKSWVTKDPLWPAVQAYSYGLERPTIAVDPSGTVVIILAGVAFTAAEIYVGVTVGTIALTWLTYNLNCLFNPTAWGCSGTTYPRTGPIGKPSLPPATPCPSNPQASPKIRPFPLLPPWLRTRPFPFPFVNPWPDGKGGTDCEGEKANCFVKKGSAWKGLPLKDWVYPPWDPVCDTCYTRCKNNGSWPVEEPCDYWLWHL